MKCAVKSFSKVRRLIKFLLRNHFLQRKRLRFIKNEHKILISWLTKGGYYGRNK